MGKNVEDEKSNCESLEPMDITFHKKGEDKEREDIVADVDGGDTNAELSERNESDYYFDYYYYGSW